MRFTGYERKLTVRGDREAVHAVFEIGRMANPFGSGDGQLNVNYTKAGLKSLLFVRQDPGEDRLVMLDVLLNWPDDETVNTKE